MTILPRAIRSLAAVAVAASVALGGSAAAVQAAPSFAHLTAGQRETVNVINTYFNKITTMEGKFTQIGPDGSQADGYFVIDRPGKMRFRYYPPAKLDIIADGKTVAVDDKAVRNQTLYLLSETPLRFLLAKNMDLTKEATVQKVDVDQDLITVVLEDLGTFASGRLTMIFDGRTVELKQWTVTDAQGLDTTVTIYDVKLGQPTQPDWFRINYSQYRK